MYTPHPIPTLAPENINAPYLLWFGVVDDIWGRIILTLKSIPVVANPNGLFDPGTGQWLTPAVSFYDVIFSSIFLLGFIILLVRLSGHVSVDAAGASARAWGKVIRS